MLLSDEGRALITDFGLSSIAMTTAKLTPVTFPGGTIRWTAPELLKGDDDDVRLTKACDVWSFGCLCYEVRVPLVHGVESKQWPGHYTKNPFLPVQQRACGGSCPPEGG